tara:strand:+ start:329 stop:472 length:144 start_codon:yes stop_codon:yes gene_type:complete
MYDLRYQNFEKLLNYKISQLYKPIKKRELSEKLPLDIEKINRQFIKK